ncbi:MAG: hypothetical protein KDE33_28825 [Bacteroidetes bacterium]|nr:hypothetical protein [Bacteroidota bacterium]
MQDIIKHFVQKKPLYSSCINNPRDMEEIITEANGDARKAFHLIYHRKISQLAPKGPPKCQQLSLSSKKKSNIDVVEEK